jgi:hypothetical protein
MDYKKAFAAVAATILSAVVAALTGDGSVNPVEWVNIAILAVGSAAVFAAPNVPGAAYTKSILAVLTAVLTLLTSVITDGISVTEWMQLALAALSALGVYAVPNRPAPATVNYEGA